MHVGDIDTDWYPDPSGRFEERFLLRGAWSSLVRDAGQESVDHPGELPIPAGIATLVAAGAETSAALAPGSALPPPASPLTGTSAPGDASSIYRTGAVPPPPPPPGALPHPFPSAHDDAAHTSALPAPPVVRPVGPGRSTARKIAALVGAVGLLAAGTAVYERFVVGGPSWPQTWDPKVTALVQFVESERGLAFEHPVTITYLSDDAFNAFINAKQQQGQAAAATSDATAGAGATAGADATAEAEQAAASTLNAVGLHDGPLDLGEASSDLSTGIVGLYTNEDQTIRLRGSELTADVQLTLVHELTHALQDQHFSLMKMWNSATTDTAASAVTALLEGDARRVELAYYASLTDAEQSKIDELESETIAEGTFDEAPMIFQVGIDAPYTFGSLLIRSLLANGGNDAVDEAFINLPDSELSLFNPLAHLNRVELGHVDAPVLPEELKALGEPETFGPLSWYLIASTRLDVGQALDLADLWRGDQSVTYSRPDGVSCVRSAITTGSVDETAELQALLTKWAAAVPAPAEPPTIASNKVSVVVDSCDQSGSTPADLDQRISAAYAVAATRASVWATMLESDPDVDLPTVECYGNYVVRSFTSEELLGSPDPTPEQQAILDAGRQACLADPATVAPAPTTTVAAATPDASGSATPTTPSL